MNDTGDLELTGTVEVEEGKFDYVRGIGDAGMYFLPEVHQARYGTDPRRGMRSYIPKDMSGLYRECIVGKSLYAGAKEPIKLRQMLELDFINNREHYSNVVPDEVLEKLRERDVPIYFGDVDVVEIEHWLLDPSNHGKVVMAISALNLVLLLAMNDRRALDDKDSEYLGKLTSLDEGKSKSGTGRISRRDFLRGFVASGAVFSTWLISPNILDILHRRVYDRGVDIDSPKLRKMADVYGVSSLFHPENLVVNFRNIYWAQNLLLIQEQIDSRGFKIGMAAGANHSGVKQFYAIGREFGRATLMALMYAYPKEVLKKQVEAAGGLDNFCLVNEYKPDNQNDEGYALSRSIQNNDLKKLLRRRGVS